MRDVKVYSQNIGNLDVTVEITMTLSEWKSLKEQLPLDHPSNIIRTLIWDFVHQYEKQISQRFEKP